MNKKQTTKSPIRQIIGQLYWFCCWILLISDKNLGDFGQILVLVGIGLLITGVVFLCTEVYAVLKKKKEWSITQLSPVVWVIIIAASKYWGFDKAIIAVYFILIFVAVVIGLLGPIKSSMRYMREAYQEISQRR